MSFSISNIVGPSPEQMAQNLVNNAREMCETVQETAQSVANTAEDVCETVQETAQIVVGTAAGEARETIQRTAQGVANAASSAFETAGRTAQNVANAASAAACEALRQGAESAADTADTFVDVADRVAEHVRRLREAMNEPVEDMVRGEPLPRPPVLGALETFLREVRGATLDLVQSGVEQAKDGVEQALGTIRDKTRLPGPNGRDLVGRDPRLNGQDDNWETLFPRNLAPDGIQEHAVEPESSSGPKSIWERLWDIIAKLEGRLKEQVDAMSDKVDRLDGLNSEETPEQSGSKPGAVAGVGSDSTNVEAGSDTETLSLEQELKRDFFFLQRLQDSIQQITTAMSNLQKADHDSKMAILRNIA
ncbi:MAG: hypothetical protein JSV78_05540 [Phycisphaerales bacterium]|nr:MAG: hypothetical protein JSV78_05540 [Phycisphaerales bacterium]